VGSAKFIGSMEYGRIPYVDSQYFVWLGDMEYGRIPAIGYIPYKGEGKEVLDVIIPRRRYNTTDYPNLDPNADGQPIPLLFGHKSNIIPVCIDTTQLKYKICDENIGELYSIEKIEADGETLTPGTDYTEDLANCEFTLTGTPKLSASTTYYFVLEADFSIDGSNYLQVAKNSGYGDGQAFEIDGGGSWTGKSYDLVFEIYGKEDLDSGSEELKVRYIDWSGWSYQPFRDASARTRIAQSFTTPAGNDFYVTRVVLWFKKIGSPSGTAQIAILSQYSPSETQVGSKSQQMGNKDISQFSDGGAQSARFTLRSAPSEILVEAKGYKNADSSLMTNVSDILKKVLNSVLDISDSNLDLTEFSNLKSKRTQELAIYLDSEMSFQEFVERLEASCLFKLIPTLDGKLAPIVFESGEPSGTPHLRDEYFVNFQMSQRVDTVKYNYKIKYDENPAKRTFSVYETTSDVAKYLYRNEETLEIETYLKNSTDAQNLASSLKSMYETPRLEVYFSDFGIGYNQVPTEKVKLTRNRALYSNGKLSTVLFRIREISKRSDGLVEVRAILDSQTY